MPRSRNLVLRLVAILFGVAMALVVAEIGLRVARWPGPPLRSGRLETQHRSPPSRPDFRDRGNPLESEKPAGVRRIVVVGDSFTWGAGVLPQDAYPDRMQAELDRRQRMEGIDEAGPRPGRRARRKGGAAPAPTPVAVDPGGEPPSREGGTPDVEGARSSSESQESNSEDARSSGESAPLSDAGGQPRIEILNFSRPGWNTPLELGALRRAIDRLAPDVLVLGYCLNDSEPSRKSELAELRLGVFPGEPETSLARFLFAHSALFRIAFQRADNLRMRRATTAYYHRLYADDQPSWAATRRALSEMHSLAASRGVPFLLVVFPIFDSQLDSRYHYRALHETMAQTADELGMDRVDLLARYVGIDARRLALDPFLDAHPSELAHRIAASAILEELEARGWLKVPSG